MTKGADGKHGKGSPPHSRPGLLAYIELWGDEKEGREKKGLNQPQGVTCQVFR